MYALYLAGTRFPVPPDKLKLSIKGKNETATLISGEQINLIKKPGLTEISFKLLLPAAPNHFSDYPGGVFHPPNYYTELLEYLAASERYFSMDLYRELPGGGAENGLEPIQIPVTLESYEITEDAEQGQDWTVEVELKQYRAYGTKVLEATADGKGWRTARTDSKPAARVVTVNEGDTLAKICRQEFGRDDPETLDLVYRMNQAEMDKMNRGDTSYIIETPEAWGSTDYTTKANAAALFDKAFLGGHDPKAPGCDPGVHWAQPYVASLFSKGVLTDREEWLNGLDGNVSQALLLALADKVSGGMCAAYAGREADHWGRNHLDSLCDKGIIGDPENWMDFDGPSYNSRTLALVDKTLAATVDRYGVYAGMRLIIS